jgi:hypothetical protein
MGHGWPHSSGGPKPAFFWGVHGTVDVMTSRIAENGHGTQGFGNSCAQTGGSDL